MKKIKFLLTKIAIGAFFFSAYYFGNCETLKGAHFNNQVEMKPGNVTEQTTRKDDVQSNWKTYINNRLAITFQYPDTWSKYGEESNAINRSGEVMSIKVSFIDTISQSIFNIEYHLAPYGKELFKLAEEQYNSSQDKDKSNAKQDVVAGLKAIETFTTMRKDIHGNIYDPALKLIHIVFLDKQKTGGFNLNFKTPEPRSEVEIAKFNQLLSTINFIN